MERIDPRTSSTRRLKLLDGTMQRCMKPSVAEPTSAYDMLRALLPLAVSHVRERDAGAIDRIIGYWCVNDRAWSFLADEAEFHGVTPLLAPMIIARFEAARAAIPDDARRIFVALAKRHQRASVAREACIDRLLAAFDAANVPLLLLKGAALAHILYSAPHLRAALDVDVLIDPADEACARQIIRMLGYSFLQEHEPGFARQHHHLPTAITERDGFTIALEIHRDAMSPDQPHSITLRTMTQPPQIVHRGAGPSGLAFGHIDMLHHLARHAFEPASHVRLIHLYDLLLYRTIFREAIDWCALHKRHPHVSVVLQLVDQVFSRGDDIASHPRDVPAGIGLGMLPLVQIAAADIGLVAKMGKLLNPPAWWLHGYYGVPPGRSLLSCRAVRHPGTVVRWLGRRLMARATARAN
ncbi:MAG: hypothetical protein GEU95_05080 [Rhizobiales bacterium]|nr:hypothetical protein [Hyphomicrobiales bacterium]